MTLDDGIFQIERAANRRVTGKIRANRRNRRFLNMLRRGKVRLTCGAVHNFDSLLAQFFGLRDCSHGGRRFNAVDAIGEFHCCRCFGYWTHALPAFSFLD